MEIGDKYGYPVFIVLDKDGKQIHTQDSSVLEEGKGYSLDKVKKFLKTGSLRQCSFNVLNKV